MQSRFPRGRHSRWSSDRGEKDSGSFLGVEITCENQITTSVYAKCAKVHLIYGVGVTRFGLYHERVLSVWESSTGLNADRMLVVALKVQGYPERRCASRFVLEVEVSTSSTGEELFSVSRFVVDFPRFKNRVNTRFCTSRRIVIGARPKRGAWSYRALVR